MIELAFLRGFLAWETFLEESFLLHMLGKRPRRGRPPVRYVLPRSRKQAFELVSLGQQYVRWEQASEVTRRAEWFFRDGRPFASALRARQSTLEEARALRNAVAHRSESAQQKFENLARSKLAGALPHGLTVGAFLNTMRRESMPPESFLEHYLGILQSVAEMIIRP